MSRKGFTLVEIIFAITILSVAILGIAASATRMLDLAGDAEIRTRALQAADDRINQIQVDPRYSELESLYEGTESDLPGLEDFDRITAIDVVQENIQGGGTLEYTVVAVTVEGPVLSSPIKRTIIRGEE